MRKSHLDNLFKLWILSNPPHTPPGKKIHLMWMSPEHHNLPSDPEESKTLGLMVNEGEERKETWNCNNEDNTLALVQSEHSKIQS
jgi:hypothetical protein